jgi:hypothetical protein
MQADGQHTQVAKASSKCTLGTTTTTTTTTNNNNNNNLM